MRSLGRELVLDPLSNVNRAERQEAVEVTLTIYLQEAFTWYPVNGDSLILHGEAKDV